jgi:glutamyl-tRNA reductase
MGRLSNLSMQERELIEGMAAAIVNKLIHNTMITLKSEVQSSDGAAFIEAARRFFNLSDAPEAGIVGAPSALDDEPEGEQAVPRASVKDAGRTGTQGK